MKHKSTNQLLDNNSVIRKGLYRHFKGNYYLVLGQARHSEDQELMVIYRALYGSKEIWLRPFSMFTETIERDGKEQARFAWCEKQSQVLEIVVIDVVKGQQLEFEKAFSQAEQILSSVEGYISHELKRCIEEENKYLLSVEWQTLESHTVNFRESDSYQEWRKLMHHFFAEQPSVLHYQSVS